MMNREYLDRAGLMLRVLPHVLAENCFVLKGGTAINFFVRDFARLSVDIDLTYLQIEPRLNSLERIEQALLQAKKRIVRLMPEARVQESCAEGRVVKLTITGKEGQVKVEPNLLLRGTVYGEMEKELSPKAREKFKTAVSARMSSLPDLFGARYARRSTASTPGTFLTSSCSWKTRA